MDQLQIDLCPAENIVAPSKIKFLVFRGNLLFDIEGTVITDYICSEIFCF